MAERGARALDAKRPRKDRWSPVEDMMIRDTVERIGTQWPRVAAQLAGRTPDAVRNRWHRLQKTGNSASMGGDSALHTLLLLSCGEHQPQAREHAAASSDSTDSTGETCIKGSSHGRAMWRAEEDTLIVEGVKRYGFKWRQLQVALPGRSDSSIRNRWVRIHKDAAATSAPLSAALTPSLAHIHTSTVAVHALLHISARPIPCDAH